MTRRDASSGGLELLLTVEQVASYLQLSTRQIRRLIASGDLPVKRIGRAVRVPQRALQKLMDTR
jgi:excisionase family DNA binding protein